ncbi:MAG TPA: SdiA-regulated domain-containing protein [Bacteroidota bacterium]|nr:SdiA-regulated domain-containing protein [Bacteroidota bacterium]
MTHRLLLLLCLLTTALPAQSILDRYDFRRASSVVELPAALREISGLAAASADAVYAHNDERGRVFVIDVRSGALLRSFDLGSDKLREDFEGIAYAEGKLWLTTSSGTLYEFQDGADGSSMRYTVHRSALNNGNDVEGLCYDAANKVLLLACKGTAGKGAAGDKAIYAFSVDTRKLDPTPRFSLPKAKLERHAAGKGIGPSGIEYLPQSGTFLLLSSEGRYLLELRGNGEIIGAVRLEKKRHRQPEGVTMLRDGTLVISDEGGKHGTLTLYRHK